MLTIRLGAPLIDDVVAALQAQLPALIADWNADPSSQVTLAAPVEYVFGAQGIRGVTGYPVVEVAAAQGRTGTFTIDREEFDHDPVVRIVVWHSCVPGDLPATYRMSLGYLSCCAAVLLPKQEIAEGVEISNDTGFFWRVDALPADVGEDGRATRLEVSLYMALSVLVVERFEEA